MCYLDNSKLRITSLIFAHQFSMYSEYYLKSLRSIALYCSFIILNVNVLISNQYMVELRRVELLTSCLQGRRSSRLSYTPNY